MAQPTPTGPPPNLGPGLVAQGIAAPEFPTQLTGAPTNPGPNGTIEQPNPAQGYTNLFDASGNFLGQYDESQLGANGMPVFRITNAANHQVAIDMPDASTLPVGTLTTVGDFALEVNADGTVTADAYGMTTTGAYNAATDSVAVTFEGVTSTFSLNAAEKSLIRARARGADGTNCALLIAAAIAAIVALTAAIIAAAAACAALANNPLTWALVLPCLKEVAALIAVMAGLAALLNTLIKECASPTPSPSPPPTPTPTPAPTASPSPSPTGARSPSPSPGPTGTTSPSPSPGPTGTQSPSPSPAPTSSATGCSKPMPSGAALVPACASANAHHA